MNARAWMLGLGLFTAASTVAGCGSGDDPADLHLQDAGPGADASSGLCNPVTQQGCEAGEKCAHLVAKLEPLLVSTSCVPNGDVAPGEACSVGEAGVDTGFDDCQAESDQGYHCLNGRCVEVCGQTPNTCADGNCVALSGVFSRYNSGICTPKCDVTLQDCAEEAPGCYLEFAGGKMSCNYVSEAASNLGQGEPCLGPSSGVCYTNACAIGYGAVLNESPMSSASLCAFFCNPSTDDPLGDPEGIQVTFDGGGVRMPGPGFLDSSQEYECRWINSFYNNAGEVPDNIGMAVPVSIWGSCAEHVPGDPEQAVPGCQPLSELQPTMREKLQELPAMRFDPHALVSE